MKYLVILTLLVVTVSASAIDLKYWEDEYPWPPYASPYAWNGVRFELEDLDPDCVEFEIQQLSLGFENVYEGDTVIVFIINGGVCPDWCWLEDLYDAPGVVTGFTVYPQNQLHVYEVPGYATVNDPDGYFWVWVYTDKAYLDRTKLYADLNNGSGGYTSTAGGPTIPPTWPGSYMGSQHEAHITVHGEMTMSLEPLTWAGIKGAF